MDNENSSEVDIKGTSLAIRIDTLNNYQYWEDIKPALQETLKELKLTVVAYFASHEYGAKTTKEHYHMYIELKDQILVKEETFAGKYNKILKPKLPLLAPSNKSVQFCKTEEDYLVYISKDLDITETDGIDETFLEKIITKTKEINIDKEKSTSEKVYEALNLSTIETTSQFVEQVVEYYKVVKNKPPPQRHIMVQHLQYYLAQQNKYEALNQLYGFQNIIL